MDYMNGMYGTQLQWNASWTLYRGCTGTIFLPLKEACLLPFYFKNLREIQNSLSTLATHIFFDIKLSVPYGHSLRLWEVNFLSHAKVLVCGRGNFPKLSIKLIITQESTEKYTKWTKISLVRILARIKCTNGLI